MLLIKNGRVLNPATNTDALMDVLVDGERIAEVAEPDKLSERAKDAEIFDAAGWIIAPGFIGNSRRKNPPRPVEPPGCFKCSTRDG